MTMAYSGVRHGFSDTGNPLGYREDRGEQRREGPSTLPHATGAEAQHGATRVGHADSAVGRVGDSPLPSNRWTKVAKLGSTLFGVCVQVGIGERRFNSREKPEFSDHAIPSAMKTPVLLLGLCVAALASYAASAMRDIPFTITSQQFEGRDSITIESVSATSPELKVGDTVVVRGRYHLETNLRAKLGFFLTTSGPSAPTPIAPKQQAQIVAGDGTFELEHVVSMAGRLHVSFYEVPRGSSFGGVYFGPAHPPSQ
jgi:hypothetical protein